MKFLVVIPARWQSSRFPGKPLADLAGKPVLAHVWDQCRLAVDDDNIVIATDDDRIADVMRDYGARVAMTSPDCRTGTDRVAEVARQLPADWYVNVQGDEPFVNPLAIAAVIEIASHMDAGMAVVNTMSAITNERDFRSSTVPKVVTDLTGRLLYMSRAAIPTDKTLSFHSARRQVGLYAFRQSALSAYTAREQKTPLEEIEDIEILRFVEMGYPIQMIDVDNPGPAIDTPEDLVRATDYMYRR